MSLIAAESDAALSSKASKPKRSSVACTRCRQLRVKCIHQGSPPCSACRATNKDDTCLFPPRGTSLQDRAPRGLRKRRKKTDLVPPPSTETSELEPSADVSSGLEVPVTPNAPSPSTSQYTVGRSEGSERHRSVIPSRVRSIGLLDDPTMPPHSEILEAVEASFSGYFQLSPVHRPTFMHLLETRPDSLSKFLVMSLLSMSARFSPSLEARFGTPKKASEFFCDRANAMVMDELISPNLEKVQALFILGQSDWGGGLGFRARLTAALANQMALLIKLDVDDTTLSPLEIETRRRTWWFLLMHNVHSGIESTIPLQLQPLESTVPLPSHEEDWAFGHLSHPPSYFPKSRTEKSIPPHQLGTMSLCGAKVSIIVLWGKIARYLCGIIEPPPPIKKDAPPWNPSSLYDSSQKDLVDWLARLSDKQKWSVPNLLAYKAANLDLAFYNLFANFHVMHIAIRRQYLPIMMRALHPHAREEDMFFKGERPPSGIDFWKHMGHMIVTHAYDLIELQMAVSSQRTSPGGTPFMAFAIYLAGTILNYLRYCPWLCFEKQQYADNGVSSAIDYLRECTVSWPVATRWYRALRKKVNTLALGKPAEEAEGEIDRDKSAGMFREHDEEETDSDQTDQNLTTSDVRAEFTVYDAEPGRQLDAASTLAQLSGRVHPQQNMNGSGKEMFPDMNHFTPTYNGFLMESVFNADHFESELSAYLSGDTSMVDVQFGAVDDGQLFI